MPDKSYAATAKAKQRERDAAAGLCSRGCRRPARPGKRTCAECSKTETAANAKRREEAFAAGKCVMLCGRDRREDRRTCEACSKGRWGAKAVTAA